MTRLVLLLAIAALQVDFPDSRNEDESNNKLQDNDESDKDYNGDVNKRAAAKNQRQHGREKGSGER